MRPLRINEARARGFATELLASAALDPQLIEVTEITVGFANHNWRVRTGDGRYVLKVGPITSQAKWSAAELGRVAAVDAGLTVPRLRAHLTSESCIVRLYDWIVGRSPGALESPEAQQRLGAQLGEGIAALHARDWPWFGSRLDGSGGTYESWSDYVLHRLDQIASRINLNKAPRSGLCIRVAQEVASLSEEVSADCRPVVCHRDLHVDNLLVKDNGELKAILDWDMPEAWDAAGEWFKLETMLFPTLPHTRAPLEEAYAAAHSDRAAWSERVRLVVLLESLNVVSNTGTLNPSYVTDAIARLEKMVSPGNA